VVPLRYLAANLDLHLDTGERIDAVGHRRSACSQLAGQKTQPVGSYGFNVSRLLAI